MTFLNPAGLLFLLGIPVAILFHLLKIRRQRVMVSSTLLWTDSLRDQQASAPFRRFRPTLLLLLQILIILILSLALARPVRTIFVSGYEHTVLILDTSASLQATDVSPSRFAAAQRAALALADRLRPGQQAMVIESAREARVLVPFTEDRRAIRQAIQSLSPLDVGGRIGEAFRLAQANLRVHGGPAAVEVFTDGAFDLPTLPDLGGAAVHWHRFAQRGRNVGITAFQARRAFFGSGDYQAFLSVANFGSEPASFDLRLSLDGKLLKIEHVSLEPEVKRSLVMPFTDERGGILKAEIDDTDDLAVDNQAVAVIPAPRPLRVLLVSIRPFLIG